VPVSLKVTVCEELPPVETFPNEMLAGDTEIPACAPVPLTASVIGE